MSTKWRLIGLAAAAGLGLLGSATAAFALGGGYDYESTASPPEPRPCSLAGVNAAYHPDIFGNPAVASAYGYVQAKDGSWHVACGGRGSHASAGANERPHRNSHSHKVNKPH
jgi:hypothetical protein